MTNSKVFSELVYVFFSMVELLSPEALLINNLLNEREVTSRQYLLCRNNNIK